MARSGAESGWPGPAPGRVRYRMTIEYDGRPFQGFQVQAHGPSVQGALEAAIAPLSQRGVRVHTAGRTDTGVHATGQVVHVDLDRDIDPGRLMDAVNARLRPQPVAVLDAAVASEGFHARFSGIERAYVYRIVNRRAPLTVDQGLAWHVLWPLDVEAMHAAAQRLVGRHDFTTFRATHCQADSPLRTLDRLDVMRAGQEVHIHTSARSFLHHQVRNMAGALVEIGRGKWTADDLSAALAAKDRRAGARTAPPDGLTLTRVGYPPDDRLGRWQTPDEDEAEPAGDTTAP